MPSTRLRVLVYGLEAALAEELKSTLASHDVAVVPAKPAGCAPDLAARSPHVVFCGSQAKCRESVLISVTSVCPQTPVIVTSRQPETTEWLDALESGASDYCSAPFEARQIAWILESTVQGFQAVA